MNSRCFVVFGVLCGLAVSAFGASPVVTRVEPPDWWVGHSWNPVRLLIEGEHLFGARVSPAPGLIPGEIKVSANGRWVLVDVTIDPKAKPGRRTLPLATDAGTAPVHFSLRRLPGREGSFQGFSPADVIYLGMTDRFANGDRKNDDPAISAGLLDRTKPRHYHGGDLAGVTQKLPYLQDLGISAVWLTPWYDNVNHLNQLEKYTSGNQRSAQGTPSTDYHGYGAVDFYGVEERFGDMATLRKLVQQAHRRGIKIVQDQVANHTGPYHRWTTNAPAEDWYNGTVEKHLENAWETWTIADPKAPAEKRKATLDGWFINILPDLNQNNADTSAYLIQNSLWWISHTGLDAVRQDTLPYVPRAHWSRWTAALKREHPNLTVLGEMWDGNPRLVAFFQGGRQAFDGIDTGVDTLFDFPLCYAIRDVFARRQPMARLTDTLAADTNYVNARVLVTFLGLHDMPRFLSEGGADVTGLKLAFTFLLTTRGTPLIYYGDEVAMQGGGDPDNRRDFPGGFPHDPVDAFSAAGRTPEQDAVHDHVRRLLGLRRAWEPLCHGEMTVVHTARDSWACVRRSGGEAVLVVINNGSGPLELELDERGAGMTGGHALRCQLTGGGEVSTGDGKVRVKLPGRSAEVITR